MLLQTIVDYLEFKRPRVRPLSVQTYDFWLKRWAAWRDAQRLNPDLASIDQDEIQSYLDSQVELADYSRRAIYSVLRAFWRWCARSGRLDGEQLGIFDRYDGVAAPIVSARLRSYYSRSDFERLLAACTDDRQRAILWTLWDTGIRARELCGLRCEDLILAERCGQIEGKGGARRWIFWSADGWDALSIYRGSRSSGPLFFRSSGAEMDYNALAKVMKRLTRRAGVLTPPGGLIHGFRHSFAQSALDAGISDLELQQLMGHASIVSTQTYTRRSRAQLGRVHTRIR